MTGFVHVPARRERTCANLKLERHPVQLMLGEQVHDLPNGTRYVKNFVPYPKGSCYQTFFSREATYFESRYIF